MSRRTLTHGHRYQGEANLPWPVSTLVTEESAVEYLKGEGWLDPAVWLDKDSLPDNWGPTHPDAEVFAKATWAGPTGPQDMSDAVVKLLDLGSVPMGAGTAFDAQKAAGQAAYNAAKGAKQTRSDVTGLVVAAVVVGGAVWFLRRHRS